MEAANDMGKKLQRICGGSFTKSVVNVAQEMWWKLQRICGGN